MAEERKMVVGTHNGSFHCDEAMACAILFMAVPDLTQDGKVDVVHTRDPAVLSKCAFVVDVGGVYDFESGRFDHHQPTFNEKFHDASPTPMSSAGLVYKHYGMLAIKSIVADISSSDLPLLFRRVYDMLIESVDANDNGIPQFEGQPAARYKIMTALPARVRMENTPWSLPQDDKTRDLAFKCAVKMCWEEFRAHVADALFNWLPATKAVGEAYANRLSVHPSGQVIELPSSGIPWASLLADAEKKDQPPVLLVLYPSDTEGFSIKTTSVPGTWVARKLLPTPWRGLNGAALDVVLDIPGGGAIFCHKAGFVASHKTREGALAMADKALKWTEK